MESKLSFLKLTSYGWAAIETVAFTIRDCFVDGIDYLVEEPIDPYEAAFGELGDIAAPSGTSLCINGVDRLLDKEDGFKNLLVAASTGAGKTSIIGISNILMLDGASAVIHCPSGQSYDLCAGYLASHNYTVSLLDFNDPASSVCINPLDFVSSPNEIYQLLLPLVESSLGKVQDRFWLLSSISLLSCLIRLQFCLDTRYKNLANTRHLLIAFTADPKAVDKLFIKYADTTLFNEYKSLLRSNEKTLASVVMTAKAALELWSVESVAQITARTTLDIQNFRSGRCALFIKNATFDAPTYRPLLSLLVEHMMAAFMKHLPEKDDMPIYFSIDEADTLHLRSLSQLVSNNRKYKIGCILFYQNISQLFNAYGMEDGTTILANCHNKLYLGGTDMRTAKELEQLLGTRTVVKNGRTRTLPLLTAQNIRMMKQSEALLISGNHKPFLVKVTPYYEQPFLKLRINKKAYQPKPKNIPQTISLIPLT